MIRQKRDKKNVRYILNADNTIKKDGNKNSVCCNKDYCCDKDYEFPPR